MLGIVCHLITFVHIYNKFTIEVFVDARRDHREAVFGDARRDYQEDSVAEITEKKFRLPNLATHHLPLDHECDAFLHMCL